MQQITELGQLFMVGFDALSPNEHIAALIREQRIGGVILFRRNVHTPQQLSELCRQLQEINAQVSSTPLLIALDQEGGMVMRIEQGVTPMPAAMAYQAAGSEPDCETLHHISADEMRQLGVNMLLAPVLDVNNNPLNPVIGVRAFGEDADTVIRYGMAALRGIQSSGMAACAKHFPGHGDTCLDSHYAMDLVPHELARLHAVELRPFKAAIAQGVSAIMTAHVAFPAIEPDRTRPATLSQVVITDLLRGELGFQGVVISDCLEMGAIANGVGVAAGAVASLQAGADIVLVSHQPERQRAAIAAVVAAAQGGQIAPQRLQNALQHVRRLKQMPAVQDWRRLSATSLRLRQAEALALAQKVQSAALQVRGGFRPLNPSVPVALITVEVRSSSEIDEVALARNQEPRSSMLEALQVAGMQVSEYSLSAQALDDEVRGAIAFAAQAQQIVLQTYNAALVQGQQRLIVALPQSRLWLVAWRMPQDLDLAPQAQGRLASFGCRPAALAPVVEKLLEH